MSVTPRILAKSMLASLSSTLSSGLSSRSAEKERQRKHRSRVRKKLREQLKAFAANDFQRRREQLYRPPVVRQFWGDDQEAMETNWAELFFDLIYVAVVFKLGDQLDADISAGNYGDAVFFFFAQFTPLYSIWFTRTAYFSRFTTDSLFHKLRDIFEAVLAAFMALFIGTSTEIRECENFNTLLGFTTVYTIYRFVYMLEFVELLTISYRGVGKEGIRITAMNDLLFETMSFFLGLLSVITSALEFIDATLGILISSFVLINFLVLCRFKLNPGGKPGIPIHVMFVIERLGEFTM